MEREGWSPWSLGSGAHLGQGCLSSGQSWGGGVGWDHRGREEVCQPAPGLSRGRLRPAGGNIVPGLAMVTAHVSPSSELSQNNGPETQGQAATSTSSRGSASRTGPAAAGWLGARTASPLLSKEARGGELLGEKGDLCPSK